MDKKYIENQYHLAVLDFQTARSEEAQGEVTERTDSRFPLRHYSQQKRVSRVNAAVIDRP